MVGIAFDHHLLCYVVMVEGSASEVSEEVLCEAVMLGFKNVCV